MITYHTSLKAFLKTLPRFSFVGTELSHGQVTDGEFPEDFLKNISVIAHNRPVKAVESCDGRFQAFVLIGFEDLIYKVDQTPLEEKMDAYFGEWGK